MVEFTLVTLWFYLFFLFTVIIYYLLPKRLQWFILILICIAFFLLSSTKYTILYMLFVADVTFLATIGIRKNRNKKLEKVWMTIGIVGNVSVLVVLKYLGFFIGNIDSIARVLNGIPMLIQIPEWAAPIGISFYTLSAIGYIVDCYWGLCKPSGNFFKDLLFICYWPVLTSGPIIKHSEVSKDLFSEHNFDIDRICFGIQRMLWGISKKIVLSARIGGGSRHHLWRY